MKKFTQLFITVLTFITAGAWSVSAWGGSKSGSWTVATAVIDGKGGSATAKIYTYNVFTDDTEQKSVTETSATTNSTTYTQTKTQWIGTPSLDYQYPYYIASVYNGYSFDGWYNTSNSRVSTDLGYYPREGEGILPHGAANSEWSYTFKAKFTPVAVSSAGSANAISFNQPETKTVTLYFPVSTNADSNDDFNKPTITANKVWTVKSWNLNTTTHKVEVVCEFAATADVAQGSYVATVTLKAKSNESNTGTVTANVDLTPTISVAPESHDFGMFTVNVDAAMTKTFTITKNANAVTITKTDNASIAPFSASISGNTLTVTYYPTAVGTGSYSATLRITATNGQASALSAYQDITLEGQAQSITYPQYTCNIEDSYFVEDEAIDLQELWTSTSNGEITYSIEKFTPSGSNNGGANPPAISSDNRYLSLGQAGEVQLKLTQKKATSFYADSDTKTITINKHETTIKGTNASPYTLMVDANTVISNYSTSNTSDQYPSYGNSNDFYYTISNSLPDNAVVTGCAEGHANDVIGYTPSSQTITAYNAGTAILTITQKETYKYSGATRSFNVAVYKYNSVFANVADIDEAVEQAKKTGYTLTYTKPNAGYIGTNHAAGNPTKGSTSGAFYYVESHTIQTDKQAGCAAKYMDSVFVFNPGTKDVTGKNKGEGSITLHQNETYKYNASEDQVINVTVSKIANPLTCKFDGVDAWTKTLNFDEYTVVAFGSANSITPLKVDLKKGDSIASYNPSNGRITASCNIGEAVWYVSQAENYMFVAGDTLECKVTVGKKQCPTCYAYMSDPDKVASGVNVVGWDIDSIADVLTFNMKKKGTIWGDNALLSWWITDHYTTPIEVTADNLSNYKQANPNPIQLDAHTTKLKFEKGGDIISTSAGDIRSDDPYINNIRVTRLSWLKLNNSQTGVALDTIKIVKELGEANKQATFQVKISTCDNTVKLASSNPKVALSATSIALPSSSSYTGGYLDQAITLTYACSQKDTTDAIISVYTKYEHKSFVVRAITKANGQEIEWIEGYAGDVVTLPVNAEQSITGVASASSHLTPILYSTDDPSVIEISDDRESFKVIASGTATLTASQAGNSIYEATSDSKTIKATDKQIQEIVWSRSFTRGLVVGETIPLDAYVDTISSTGDRARSDAQTAKIVYTCPEDNGVVEIVEGNKLHILGDGSTQITATVVGDSHYETTRYTKSVKVRTASDGCEQHFVYVQKNEIKFFVYDFNVSEMNEVITLSPDSGAPDKLSFSVRGEAYKVANLDWYRGYMEVYQSSNSGASWTYVTKSEPAAGETDTQNDLPLDRTTNMIKFRRVNGWGVHYIEDLVITRRQYLETESNVINLGEVPAGSVREDKIPVSYSEMKTDLTITKGSGDETYNKLEIEETSIDIDCGSFGTHDIDFKFKPTQKGSWSQSVTVGDPISKQSVTVSIIATVTKGHQSIVWHPTLTLDDAQDAPRLNATATSGLPVSYELTCTNNVASIENIGGKDTVIIHKPGNFTITVKQGGNESFEAAPNLVKNFTVAGMTYVYDGDGTWSNNENWASGSAPEGDSPNVIVSGALEIDDDITVGNLTIESTGSIAVITGGTLTVNGVSADRTEYGDLHVQDDGAIQLGNSADLQVRDFILDAKLGDDDHAAASGQVSGDDNLNVNRDAYFMMTFDVSGQITYGWYDFVVPFEVDAANGVYDANGVKIVYGTDYIIMSHSEEKRARNQKAWSTFTGTLQPGRIYTITFEETKTWNTFLFKKKNGANLVNSGTYTPDYSSTIGESQDRGWNGFGNGTLQHRELTDLTGISKVQMYNHTESRYDVIDNVDWITKALAVGTAFSIQVSSAQPVVLETLTDNKPLRAPGRETRTIEEFYLTLTDSETEKTTDRLWVSASEDATGEYVIGHDLLKMGTPTQAKVAQMWTTRNNMQLCDAEMQLVGTKASAPLTLFAPEAGAYELEVQRAPKGASLFLTYNDRAIWNLSMSPYLFDLSKGTTEGYGLRIIADRQTTTDIENGEAAEGESGVRKVLIDNVLYLITPDGKMYDVVGKGVKF